jgi:hypothetical protein
MSETVSGFRMSSYKRVYHEDLFPSKYKETGKQDKQDEQNHHDNLTGRIFVDGSRHQILAYTTIVHREGAVNLLLRPATSTEIVYEGILWDTLAEL